VPDDFVELLVVFVFVVFFFADLPGVFVDRFDVVFFADVLDRFVVFVFAAFLVVLIVSSMCAVTQRSSWMRSRLPEGSRTAQSRTPYGWSIGSCTTSTSLAWSFAKVSSRSLVARRIAA